MSAIQDAVTLSEDFAEFRPSLGDIELEAAIHIEMTVVMHDERYTRDERVAAFERVSQLHRQRRPEMVRHLERMRNL